MKFKFKTCPPFTPGDWSLPHFADPESTCPCGYVLVEPYNGSICDVSVDNRLSVSKGGNDSPKFEEAVANAYLIHASPNLFFAAVNALKRFEPLGMIHGIEYQEIEELKKAISKSFTTNHP